MPIQKNKFGQLEIICGPMFSGKTEELIRRINRIAYTKKNIKVFKPKIDNRYSEDYIVSHNNKKIKCIVINENQEVLNYIKNTHVFAFDEAQFLEDDFIEVCKNLILKDKRIIVAGLDKDSNAEPFGVMPNLLAHADYITKLNAICIKCGDIANYSYRKSLEKDQILVCESEKYEARCIACFYNK